MYRGSVCRGLAGADAALQSAHPASSAAIIGQKSHKIDKDRSCGLSGERQRSSFLMTQCLQDKHVRIVTNHAGEIISLKDHQTGVVEHHIAHRLVRVGVVCIN